MRVTPDRDPKNIRCLSTDLPLDYIHTKNEPKTQSHWAVNRRFALKMHVKTEKMLNCGNMPEFTSFNIHHGDTIAGHLQTTNH